MDIDTLFGYFMIGASLASFPTLVGILAIADRRAQRATPNPRRVMRRAPALIE